MSHSARACAHLRRFLTVVGAALLLFIASPPGRVLAGPGHDHGDAPAETSAAPASPRVTATSERYQVVGIVEGEVLVLYVDRADSNEPVTTASLEVSLNGDTFKAELMKNGTYELTAPVLKTGGAIEVLINLTDGDTADLLVGSLTIATHKAGHTVATSWWSRLVDLFHVHGAAHADRGGQSHDEGWSATLAVLLVLGIGTGGFLAVRRWRARRLVGLGLLSLALVGLNPTDSLAHEGHDHGPDISGSSGNAPARRPNGAIFLPKPAQRLLEVRTRVLQPQTATKAVRLTGRIVANPNFSGVVQSTIQGRYQAPAGGVPALGMRVQAGDLLGTIAPSFASIDSSDMAQTLGDLDQKISIAQSKLARQEQLLRTNVVARAAVDDTKLELDGLVRRRAELNEARVRPEELRAPVGGVVAVTRVMSGQVVTQSERIIEIVDPSRLLVEALVFDQISPDAVSEAYALVGGDAQVKLRFLGRSRALQQQYSLMQFEVIDNTLPLNVGTAVIVLAHTGTPSTGLFVPRAAMAQAPNGQTVVFEHMEPEIFMPRAIRFEAFDSQSVLITGGITPGAKIVVRNAPLVNQVR